jgi:hypothetical protein
MSACGIAEESETQYFSAWYVSFEPPVLHLYTSTEPTKSGDVSCSCDAFHWLQSVIASWYVAYSAQHAYKPSLSLQIGPWGIFDEPMIVEMACEEII